MWEVLWSFSWLGQSNPVVWHPHCVCDCQFQRIHWTTVSVLVESKGNKKTAHWYCLSLYHCYNCMTNSVAYCCRDFVINRRKTLNEPLGYHLLWQQNQQLTVWRIIFQSWVLIGCLDQDGPVHCVGVFARCFHFKTTFWVNLIVDANG